jgi:surface polysaccharide O-acyltransferase-like enzyme
LEKEILDSNERSFVPDNLIRSLAITLVILLHAANTVLKASSVPEAYWWTAVVYKSLALPCVPLFVMLSGALLLKRSKLREPIRVFLNKRIKRLGLAVIFWSAVYLTWSFYITQSSINLVNIGEGILFSLFGGAYYHFWFIYLIVGIYLFTPILRVVIAGHRKVVRYLCLLWFIGVAIMPLIEIATGHTLNPITFILSGWTGYFVLGSYLKRVKVRSVLLYTFLIMSFIGTLFGTWLMNYPLKYLQLNNYFFDYLTINIILGSCALFMILLKFHRDWPGKKHKTLGWIVRALSKNTLPLFLFHIIIMESFDRGFFGFTLNYKTLNPIIGIPIITVLTLFITLCLILLMKKLPILEKMIG